MKKDAYYFSHFSNARNDSKIIKLRRIFGIEGYGIYFMLLEVLREQTDFKLPLASVEDLSYEWHTSKEKVLSVVNDFELFEIIDNKFFSPKLIFYLQPYLEKSERAREAALIRWNNAKADANALQMQNKCNASKVKESKVKETKVKKKEIFIPEFQEFKNYALEKKPEIDIEVLKLKYDAWVENGWKDGNNKVIKNWKSKLLNTIPYLKEKEKPKSGLATYDRENIDKYFKK
jgi:hypothetical protein